MFFVESHPFGNARCISVRNEKGIQFEILPDYGAALNALHIPYPNGTTISLLDGYTTDTEPAETGALYKGVFLFPFPNRLKDGKWQNGPDSYQFPINEPARNNALHGLLFNRSFEIEDMLAFGEKAVVRLSYTQTIREACYPFLYKIRIEFTLSEKEGLSVLTTVENQDIVSMPFGLGWHPYFKTGSPTDRLMLHVPEVRALEVDEQMIPTKVLAPFVAFNRPALLADTSLDTGFKIDAKSGKYRIAVEDLEKDIRFTVWQMAGSGDYGYVQIYTPPHKKSIAIEPMTCSANALQTRDEGLINLAPGMTHEFLWGVEFG